MALIGWTGLGVVAALACAVKANGIKQEDGSALVQVTALTSSTVGAQGRLALLDRMSRAGHAHSTTVGGAGFNCTAYPFMCQEPFNCHHHHGLKDNLPLAIHGHANLQSWCHTASWYGNNLVKECLVNRDFNRSAWTQFEWARGKHHDELDGSYCFLEGHCTDTAVTENTTLLEAEQLCDARFGHDGWTGNYMGDALPAIGALKSGMKVNGFGRDHRTTRVFLKMACAMGNYHCDVHYCRNTYCKISYYHQKYAHLSPTPVAAPTL